MKIYFAFTIVGDRGFLEHARKIVEILESHGHEVLTKHFLRDDVYSVDRLVPAEEVFHRDMKWIAQADMLIAEVSNSSFGIGYETAHVLGLGKKVLLFYNKGQDKKISLMAKGNTHPNCSVVSYASIEEVEDFIRKNL